MDNLSPPLSHLSLSLMFHLPLAMLGILENAARWKGEGGAEWERAPAALLAI